MEQNIFSPKIQRVDKDHLSLYLRNFAFGILILTFGLLPIFFLPGVFTSLGFIKSFLVILGLLTALVLLSLAILRSGSIRLIIPLPLAFFWGLALVAIISGLFSADKQDALYGNVLEVHTAGFLVLMGLVMTILLTFRGAKTMVNRFFYLFAGSTLLLQVFHLLRLFFGPDFLSFNIFTSSTVSLLGSFNDLAIFSGLVLIIGLIILQQINTSLLSRFCAVASVLISLVLLSVINFFAVWLVVGFVSLLMVLYLISKDTWLRTSENFTPPVSRLTLSIVALVCVFSAAFIISGNYLGTVTAKMADIAYMEVRPSIGATLDIASSVLKENPLLGIGPNRFEDAWREYKNPAINQTLYWDTNFSAGSGYVPTLFVNNGIIGGTLFLLFLGALLILGYKCLFVSEVKDQRWYLIGSISFISAFYLWWMAIIYVPGVTILLLAAVMTGIAMAAYYNNRPDVGILIDVSNSKQYGVLLIAAVLVIIISSVLSVLGLSKQFLANVIYADTARAFQAGAELSVIDENLRRVQELNTQDLFASERAQVRLIELARLSNTESTEITQQRYAAVLAEGISYAEQAVSLDQTNPDNYILLYRFYSLLDPVQFDGVIERNAALINKARELDPTNPKYLILQAQYKAQIGDLIAARSNLLEAIRIKGNYTDALFLLSQLDIQEGKVVDAIAVTRSIISIEPGNPTRYFQLGVLLSSTEDLLGATEAFERAVALDYNYANARYFLALAYLDQNRSDDALAQLRLVEVSNPDNQEIKSLIAQISAGEFVRPGTSFGVPVQNNDAVSQSDDVTTASQLSDTNLISPLNRPGVVTGNSATPAVKEEGDGSSEANDLP